MKDLAFSGKNGLLRQRSTLASRTGFHNSERVGNTEEALTEMKKLHVVAENQLTAYITSVFYPYTMGDFLLTLIPAALDVQVFRVRHHTGPKYMLGRDILDSAYYVATKTGITETKCAKQAG